MYKGITYTFVKMNKTITSFYVGIQFIDACGYGVCGGCYIFNLNKYKKRKNRVAPYLMVHNVKCFKKHPQLQRLVHCLQASHLYFEW